MIATVDRDCRYTSFNQEHQNELRRLTGKDTAIGMSLMEALAGMPEEQERALSLWSRALNGETVVQTMAFGDPGRYRRWYSTRHTPIRDASGAVVGAGEVTSDITEQMQVQQALRESEERFRKVFENAATGIAIKDWEGRFQQCNPAYCALLGYTQEELRRINFASLIHPEDLDANLAEIHRLQAGELPFFKIENRYVRKDGQPVWVNKFVSVLSLAPGSPANLVALVTDITDRKRAQEEMEMHRLLLDTVVNCMPVAVSLIRGSDLKLQMINPAFQAFAPGKDMLGQTLDQLWPETGQDFGALCSRVLETGEPYRVEDGLFIVRRRPGGPVEPAYFSGSLHRVRVPGEEGWGILITAWETTERKQTEVALCESAERLKRAQEIARLGSWELDLVNNQLTWSDEVYRIFGLNPGEFGATYEAFLAAVHPEDRAAVDSAYSGSIRDGRDSYEIEHRIVRRNTGEIRIVHEKCEHRRDTSGRVVRSIGMVHDVTERRKTEELRHALDEQERLRLGAAVEQASDSVVIVDLDGTIRYVNAAFESINRIPREKAVGRSYFGFLAGDPAAKDIRESAAQGIAWHGPLTRSIPEGRPVELEVTISPAIEPSGKVIGGLITEKDVTQENALQRQIRQTQKMEALGTLAGGITHDFNNILSAIIINTELALLDLDTSNPARRPLPTVLQAANRGKELVKQIITFSRQREWDRKPLEVAPVIKEAMRFLRSTLSKDVVIDETIAHDCGVVLGDPSQIHQIIVNLCQNAAQAMRDRGGDLEVKLEPVDVDKAMVARHPDLKVGPYVRLMVADRGCGMTNELMERIFEPFFTTREPGGGSGLGLAVVHGIVKSYNGAITVYSEPGKGSVFSVYLPRLEKETLASVAAKPLRAQKGNERILLVEDEEAQLKSTARLLERLGYCVTGKPSGRTALTAFKRNPAAFDLVITDQAMPRMSGLELASALAKVRSDIPIILCTGFSEKIKGDITGRDGIREFVMKPFSLQEISRIIRRALTKKDNAR
jgi:PAS domain S-box-containing protein